MALRAVAGHYPQEGPGAGMHEDTYFLADAAQRGEIRPVTGSPEIYIYRYHARNTMSLAHHQRLAHFNAGLEGVEPETIPHLAHFQLPRPFQIVRADGTVTTAAARLGEAGPAG
jgi:hypothetical protein